MNGDSFMRFGNRVVAFLLTIVLFTGLLPSEFFAAGNPPDGLSLSEISDALPDEVGPPQEIIGEEIALREEDVKHFLNSDGTHTAIQYALPVHYRRTPECEWEDINNTLVLMDANRAPGVKRALATGNMAFAYDSGKVFVPQSSPVDLILAQDTGEEFLAVLNKEGYSLSWQYAVDNGGAEPEQLRKIEGTIAEIPVEEYPPENAGMYAIRCTTGCLRYPDVVPGVDLEFFLDSVYLKENVVLKTKTLPASID